MENSRSFTAEVQHKIHRYLWHSQCLLSPNKVASFTLPDGSKFEYPLKTAIGYEFFAGGFELPELKYIKKLLKPGDTFLDVGANAGLFTIMAAKLVGPTGHVYAFEPGLRELELLRRNLAINNIKNVTIVQCAVSNECGKAEFAISKDGAMNSLAQTDHHLQKIDTWQTVEVITLDKFMEQCDIGQVNFIKIDVEGAEKLVLDGASNFLKSKNFPPILCEFCDSTAIAFQSSGLELYDKFLSIGYKLFSVPHTEQESPQVAERKEKFSYVNLLAQRV
jgi:FkbM family methyltransferase